MTQRDTTQDQPQGPPPTRQEVLLGFIQALQAQGVDQRTVLLILRDEAVSTGPSTLNGLVAAAHRHGVEPAVVAAALASTTPATVTASVPELRERQPGETFLTGTDAAREGSAASIATRSEELARQVDAAVVEGDPDALFGGLPDAPTGPAGTFLPPIIGGFPERFDPEGNRLEGSFLPPDQPLSNFTAGISERILAANLPSFVSEREAVTLASAGELYRDGDQWALFAGLAPEQKAAIQQDMVSAGLLADESFALGVWDADTARAMGNLLAVSNGNGIVWNRMLRDLKMNAPADAGSGRAAGSLRPFVTPAYLAPDYAELSQAVKAQVRRELRRDPTESEMTLLADFLATQHRASFNAQVAAARAEHNAGNRAITTDTSQSAGQVQAVNDAARFAERFEELFAPEMDRLERVDAAEANFGLLMSSLTAGDRLVSR